MASPQGPNDIRRYHVTDRPYRDSKNKSTKEPDWKKLHLCFPNCKQLDGDLTGLPVVCMTTTCYKYQKNLPTLSPYPRNATDGKLHHRVSVPFKLDSYHLFLIHTFHLQRHVLCLPKVQNCLYIHERVLLVLLQNKNKYEELTAEKHYESSQKEFFFPVVDDTGPSDTPKRYRANIYKDDPEKDYKENFFVNVHFVTPVPLKDVDATWDKVWRNIFKNTDTPIEQGKATLRQCLVNWIMTAASDEDLTDANREAIMTGFRADVSLEGSTEAEKWESWKEHIKQLLIYDDAMSSVFHDQVSPAAPAQTEVDGLPAAVGNLTVSENE